MVFLYRQMIYFESLVIYRDESAALGNEAVFSISSIAKFCSLVLTEGIGKSFVFHSPRLYFYLHVEITHE